MLLELEVRKFALVDYLVMEFGSGLTVLTGETGAGKSIILESLSFLLGNTPKAIDTKLESRVAGRFKTTSAARIFLEAQGFVPEDEILIVRDRRVSGRTSSRLNGSLVTVAQLKELSEHLVDLHGQHQSYGLMKRSSHLPMVDRMAGPRHEEELLSYRQLYKAYLSVQSEIRDVQQDERHRLREIEWLKLELEEIEKVSPKLGERELLDVQIKRAAASELLARGSSLAIDNLDGEGAVLDTLGQATSQLHSLRDFDSELTSVHQRLESAEIEIREVYRELRQYVESLDRDSETLDELQGRAESLKTLCRKYGPRVEDVLQHQEDSLAKLERLENSELVLADLLERENECRQNLGKSASKLSRNRREASAELGRELVAELSQLAMPNVAFQVEFQELEDFGADGKEVAQFLFSPNPGRASSPLSETASGGELSRVMLALVSILSRYQNQPTLIFDEIDAGLGGRTAEAVATKLSCLSEKMQVLCVTHLPVVAAAGSGHFVVEKENIDQETTVKVSEARAGARIDEIARMLSGDPSQKRARELARELLKKRG